MITKESLKDLYIRAADETDLWDLAEIHRSCWQEAFAGILEPAYLDNLTPDHEAEMWQRRFRSKSFMKSLHVADHHGFTVGYLVARPSVRNGEGAGISEWMEISEFYVCPTYWRMGVGSKMMELVGGTILANGYDKACLWALRDAESSRLFYENNGWSLDEKVRGRTDVGSQEVGLVRYTLEL